MRLGQVLLDGQPCAALIEADALRPADPPRPLKSIIEEGPEAQRWGPAIPRAALPLSAPITGIGKIIGIGLNYVAHAAEQDERTPAEPLVFAKFPSAVVGPDAAIVYDPEMTTAVDYEAELAVIIGRRCQRVERDRALDFVFGYTCLNDVTARDLQFRDGQWVRAKSLDTFCPLGPWVVTADEIPDPQRLGVRCLVNGVVMQSASTSEMLFPVADLIARLSRWCTLEPGDVIATGTPPGVGWFRAPRRILGDGDEVVVEIDGIGSLRNRVRVLGPGESTTRVP